MVQRAVVWLVVALSWVACATGGAGSNPPLPGGPTGTGTSEDGASPLQGQDAGEATPGDDASLGGDDGGMTPTSDGGATCDDFLHGLKALGVSLLGKQPAMCVVSSDCDAGECCYAGASGSACVMQ